MLSQSSAITALSITMLPGTNSVLDALIPMSDLRLIVSSRIILSDSIVIYALSLVAISALSSDAVLPLNLTSF